MKRSYRRSKKQISTVKKFRTNKQIRATELRLIDNETGKSEVISLEEGLSRAEEAELDLVEVSPLANPPVVKILDYGKFHYQQEKIQRKQKVHQKKNELKGIRLSARISDHDLDVRLNNAKRFLAKGAKVKIELILRGREHRHVDLAKKVIQGFIEKLEDTVVVDSPAKKMGNRITAMISPKQ